MKESLFIITCFSLLFSADCFSQKPIRINLHELAKEGLTVYNRELSLFTESSHQGIRLSKAEGEGVAWVRGLELSNGSIEFEVRGENLKQHSFVGLAFYGINDSTYDAIYLRPFQFPEQDPVLKKRQIQYISLPQFTWRKLREKSPGKYENEVNPVPRPDDWFKVRIVINDGEVSAYINDNKAPSLVTKMLTTVKTGAIGLYVADTSGGDFANLVITKTE